jgi:hypothetical protein
VVFLVGSASRSKPKAVRATENFLVITVHRISFISLNLGVLILHGSTINTHLQIIRIHLLHHNARGSTASIADSRTAILALLQLVQ